MAAYKFTVKRGETGREQIAVAAGSSEAQGETLSINIDATSTTSLPRGDVIIMIDAVKEAILAGPWPPLA